MDENTEYAVSEHMLALVRGSTITIYTVSRTNGAEMQNDIRKCKTTSKPGFSGLRPEKIFRFRTQLLQDGIETVAPWPVIDRFAAQSGLGALTSPHHGNDSKKGEKILPRAPFGSTSAVSGT